VNPARGGIPGRKRNPGQKEKTVLASANAGKLRELTTLLQPLGIELIPQQDLGIESATETGTTFIENALEKARHASRASGLPAIADDSGLSVEALDGAPGVYSARFAGPDATDADNNRKLVQDLTGVADTRAHFFCAIVYLRDAEDPTPLLATGRWEGRILFEPRGSNGFGYDSLFEVAAMDVTAAQLPAAEKNRISHRSQAVSQLVELLSTPGATLGATPGA
jgi:XTP/dITP diphosphohydrolase